MADTIHRFLFDDLDIRGALVHLDQAWQQMQEGRGYGPVTASLLGQMTAITAVIAGQLKQAGRLTFQLRGNGPIAMLVIDCNERLELRGMARSREGEDPRPAPLPDLLGHGQLMLSLDAAQARDTYQSFVPLEGDSLAQVFEHYLALSEQQPSRLVLAADGRTAAGLFLQKLPEADQRDPDGWNRVTQFLDTLTEDELLTLAPEQILTRLFHEETLRLFDPREVTYCCPEDWEKVRTMLRSLGREEVEAILAEHGEVVIQDEICNREYRFDPIAVAELFAAPLTSGPTYH
ncbi:Hsp33 family molecular chaperone HslO [Azospira inquinata]|uniref:Hsp33 family molecular chaperone HslO n=1 Tax=Azospira inquinata TaxID=2785627 RepID=A0A975XUW5_9RHOO|nr:Hsp33 family molecular chaperone HslO [Azospira inquinata]QWT45440.1 Hsp33 family molecular chaperone HslO [Azospira inquinata]QWT49231.1 Hsp33 family molecular chaperone HslO [Azospira inquinata]